jgi:hypothetical protein
VGTASLVSGILTEVQKVLDLVVPGFKVDAGCSSALSTAVNGNVYIVSNPQERNNALALKVGALHD